MGIIAIFLLIIFVISALLLILVIMVQDDQGEGIGDLFGGSSSSAFGPRTGNILTRFTSIVAAVFLLSAGGLAFMNRSTNAGDLARKARAEQLKEAEQSNWWVPKSQNEGTQNATGTDQSTQAVPSASSSTNPADAGGAQAPASEGAGGQQPQQTP